MRTSILIASAGLFAGACTTTGNAPVKPAQPGDLAYCQQLITQYTTYVGSVGGPAARLAQDCNKKVELIEYPELGMEAIWRIEVVDFPAFIVVDDKGNDFFAAL